MSNPQLATTLREAVDEVLGLLTGLDLSYEPELDRFNSIVRQLNRAMRACALEREWSYFSDILNLGQVIPAAMAISLPSDKRVRVLTDDAVRLVRDDNETLVWAHFMTRDALPKYRWRNGLWVAATRTTINFSRPLTSAELELDVHVPVMREPTMFSMPEQPEDPEEPLVTVPQETLDQEIDFPYPDLVCLRAAYYYAQTDPVMQPRVQTLEAQYKDLMYQIIERDERHTDAPYVNDFMVPVQNSLVSPPSYGWYQPHPHSDERR